MNNVDLQTGEETPTGETVTLGPFTWTAVTDIYTFGTDGPNLQIMLPNVRDRCQTTVSHSHQRFRAADVTGTVDGVPFSTYYFWESPVGPGQIFTVNLHDTVVAHGGKNCL